jgi:hypothetical protein
MSSGSGQAEPLIGLDKVLGGFHERKTRTVEETNTLQPETLAIQGAEIVLR